MTLRVSLGLALIFSTFAAGAQTARQPIAVRTKTTYSCGSSPAGGCAFLPYTSDCKEVGARNGHPVLASTHEVFADFSLKPGESKTFDPIPPNVKQ